MIILKVFHIILPVHVIQFHLFSNVLTSMWATCRYHSHQCGLHVDIIHVNVGYMSISFTSMDTFWQTRSKCHTIPVYLTHLSIYVTVSRFFFLFLFLFFFLWALEICLLSLPWTKFDAAKNEIDSVRKLKQSKHLTSQYIVAGHSVQNVKTAHVERGPPWKHWIEIAISKSIFNPVCKTRFSYCFWWN
jgi:hypothetical protein